MNPCWLDRSIFVSPIHYTLCTTEGQFGRVLRRLNVPSRLWPSFDSSDAALHTFSGFGAEPAAIVTITPRPDLWGTTVAALLVHEAVHLWQHIRRHTGEGSPSGEFEAYAIQTISQRLMEEYTRQVHGSNT